MQVLWRSAPATAGDVIDALAGSARWKPKTVKTLLGRLVAKKAVGFRNRGRAYEYYPLVTEKACARHERRSLLRRVYRNALVPMLAAFIEDEALSPEQIAELRRVLQRKARR
jgi:BlaI family penicillinase repressor